MKLNTNNSIDIDDTDDNEYFSMNKKDNDEILRHPSIDDSCNTLKIQKEWINTGSFYIWPMCSFTNDSGVTYDIKCGYVLSNFKAIVIDTTSNKENKDKTKKKNFIYFYGKCVVNPLAPSGMWQFENWAWKSTDSAIFGTLGINPKQSRTKFIRTQNNISPKDSDTPCCWGFC